jgi:signal transduction histidine kinase/DNA-binding NarL/FixJ family response regulator
MDFTLNEEQINQLFPFHILLNKDLNIAGQGKNVPEFIGDAIGMKFFDLFTVVKPSIPSTDFSTLLQLTGKTVDLRMNDHTTEVQQGQFIYLALKSQLLFVANAQEPGSNSNKSKEAFLANISHEIRTPMSGVLGLTKLLSRTTLDVKQQAYVKLISNSVSNLLLIVNDMLDIEKIGSGKIDLENKAFRIINKAMSTIQLFQFKSEQKDIHISFQNNLPANLVVVGDEYRFAQILSNLISNALKFTNQGTIQVSANLLFYSEKKLLIEFSVTDTGIGISDERLETIFNPFSQVSTSYTRKYGGTGLGLSICKSMVEMQGGHIKVSSKLNEGTKFTFSLPYERGDAGMINEEKPESTGFVDLSSKKILIADDVELNQFLAKSLLESWGCEVDVVENGKQALEMIKSRDYDLVLMDVQMPEMDGLTATRHVRNLKEPAKAQLPVLAFTANALKGDSVQFEEAGMSDYITKPYTEEKLYNKVARLLNLKSQNNSNMGISAVAEEKPKLYDLSMLNAIGKDSSAFTDKMISLFLKLVVADTNLMHDAAIGGNNAEVGRLAHKIKSSLSNMGINSLLEQIKTLEIKGDQNPDENLVGETTLLQSRLKEVTDQLEADFPHLVVKD